MTREIKFRFWDKNRKAMYEWVNIPDDLFSHWLVDDSLITMQYTGLKDKNGGDIYEGDVVRILYTDWSSQHLGTEDQRRMTFEEYKKSISRIGKIEFQFDRWEVMIFNLKYGGVSGCSVFPGKFGEIEIIGNIYENPELLK